MITSYTWVLVWMSLNLGMVFDVQMPDRATCMAKLEQPDVRPEWGYPVKCEVRRHQRYSRPHA